VRDQLNEPSATPAALFSAPAALQLCPQKLPEMLHLRELQSRANSGCERLQQTAEGAEPFIGGVEVLLCIRDHSAPEF
jgi:hypothetical protein